jgi:hypothetical protein
MGRSKGLALFFVLIMVFSSLSLAMVKPAYAQSSSKPSVPEFTLKIVARPFDVAPSTTVNPYTGQTVITGSGYRVQNISVDVTIKNQPSTTYYQVQFKGNYGNNWQIYSDSNMITPIQLTQYQPKSNGDYTIISIPINSNEPLNANGDHAGSVTDFPLGGQVDFQVRALIGQPLVKQAGLMGDMVFFDGQTSEWSNTQTIKISETSASLSPEISTSPTPTVPELTWLTIIPLLLAIPIVLFIIRKRITKKLITRQQQ